MKTLTIITGASKGLGFELTRQSLKAGDTVVTMERRPSKALRKKPIRSAAISSSLRLTCLTVKAPSSF